MVRSKLPVADSLRVIKLFYELFEEENGHLMWNLFVTPQDAFTALCELYVIGDLQPTPPPYLKSLEFRDIFLTTVFSYSYSLLPIMRSICIEILPLGAEYIQPKQQR